MSQSVCLIKGCTKFPLTGEPRNQKLSVQQSTNRAVRKLWVCLCLQSFLMNCFQCLVNISSSRLTYRNFTCLWIIQTTMCHVFVTVLGHAPAITDHMNLPELSHLKYKCKLKGEDLKTKPVLYHHAIISINDPKHL